MGMQLIETVTVGSGGASSIEFTSIPQDGVDLLLKVSGRADIVGFQDFSFFVNTFPDYIHSKRHLLGNGSTASSASQTSQAEINFKGVPGTDYTSNTFGSVEIYVSNYTSEVAKSISIDAVEENNATGSAQMLIAGLADTTSAVTSVGISRGFSSGNFITGSTASLYKITAD
jgi:hypothetical protein